MDIIAGQDVQMENDFMEYLRKAIISGLGVPSSFLQYSDEVDFSRSLAMQNSRFLRSIVVMQKSYNETLTKLYRKLYQNEFNMEEENSIDLSKLEISLPSPANLNMTNLADQISTISGIVDFITQTIVGQSADAEESDAIRRVVTKKYIPAVDWAGIEELIKESKIENLEEDFSKCFDESVCKDQIDRGEDICRD